MPVARRYTTPGSQQDLARRLFGMISGPGLSSIQGPGAPPPMQTVQMPRTAPRLPPGTGRFAGLPIFTNQYGAGAGAAPAPPPSLPQNDGRKPITYEDLIAAQGPLPTWDYSADPILQEIRSAALGDLEGARAGAQKGRREVASSLGSRDLASRLFGESDPFVESVSADPDKSASALARIGRAFREMNRDADANLNRPDQNLFYSGYRGKVLSDLAYNQSTAEADAVASAEQMLAQIGAELLAAEGAYRGSLIGAEGAARDRASQEAAEYGQRIASVLPTAITGPSVAPAQIRSVAPPKKVPGFGAGTVTNRYGR
jgi:hypothetical protein